MWWRRPLISDTLRGWIEENFGWVEDHRPDWLAQAPLILPTRDYFTATKSGASHETALAVAADVRRLLGMSGPFRIEPIEELPDELRHEYGKVSETAGQYWHDEDEPLVTYSPSLLRRPVAFINMMAHEMIHARLATVADDLPGGWEAHELATDLHCIIAGFGVIQLQAAEDIGWTGYMTQPSRAVALAEFLRRKELDPETALAHLSTRPARWLGKALKAV